MLTLTLSRSASVCLLGKVQKEVHIFTLLFKVGLLGIASNVRLGSKLNSLILLNRYQQKVFPPLPSKIIGRGSFKIKLAIGTLTADNSFSKAINSARTLLATPTYIHCQAINTTHRRQLEPDGIHGANITYRC